MLTVVTFASDFGLPSTGPFALKLLKWLDLAGIPYEQRFENNPAKGPKGKNPWVVLDGEPIGDTEVIIDLLGRRHGFDLEADLSPAERAQSHALRRMLEEHFHMVLEWELFVHPAGAAYIGDLVARAAPPIVAAMATKRFCGHFRRQLHARGIARHPDDVIRAKGVADMEALEALLGDRPFLGGNRPNMADVSAYGLVAPLARWPMRTPVADYIKSRPALMRHIDRMFSAGADLRAAA